jgi:glycosyltransferase involved in cell wall biosynthesis
MLFSILIPTLESRKEQFNRLYEKLGKQIAKNSLASEVEVLYFLDNKEHLLGFKRNKLIEMAKGRFVAFVDDDDDVSEDYVLLICHAIKGNPNIDCVGIKGIITFGGKKPHVFIHSLRYKEYFSRRGTYFRPPYHLNPIKREIACKYQFEYINYSEDIDWAMRICSDQALQKEYFIDDVIYFYHSERSWNYQILLDLSESFRHALGLRLANRIRMKRWLKSILGE